MLAHTVGLAGVENNYNNIIIFILEKPMEP